MINMNPIYVLADDLTGAADAANYFRTAQRRVRVSFRLEAPWMHALGPSVVQVFDSESRSLDQGLAKQRILMVARQLCESESGFFVYKKVDSTLRGHIGAEIEASLTGLGRHIGLLAPAFPKNGRVVRRGALLVNGVPVSQTPFARDPHNPVTSDGVADIVRQTTDLPVLELGEEVIRQGAEAIRRFLRQVEHSRCIVAADSSTDEDLATLAQAISSNDEVIACGSAGLARQLASIWCAGEPLDKRGRMKPCERVLVAVGSANPSAHEQLAHLAAVLPVREVVLKPVLLADPASREPELARGDAEAAASGNVGVTGLSLAAERAQRHPGLPGSFEDDLASVAKCWLQQQDTHPENRVGFVATGGDTALALCESLGAVAIWPEGEITPGMPWNEMETPLGRFPLVTKAGGFGGKEALLTAVSYLRGLS